MTDKPKMHIQSITMDGSRVTDIEVVPVDAITGTQRCEPPNLVVKGCTVHNTVTLDLALVRALVEALEAADQFIRNGIELGFIRMPSQSTPDPAHKTPDMVSAALARAKEAGL